MSTVVRIISDDRETTAMPLADAERIPEGYGIYQGFAEDGTLLYVGRTSNLQARLRQHRAQNPVWPQVAYLSWTPCDSYGEAVSLERLAISTEPGDANVTGRIDLDRAKASSRQTLPAAARQRLVDTYAMSDDPLLYEAASSYMRALRDAGWTLQSIAGPLNITRERVRQRVATAALDLDLIVPSPPAREPRQPAFRTWLWPAEQRRVDELFPLAKQVNGATPDDDPRRAASVELSELFATLILRRVPARVIAEAAGCTVAAVNLRLARHGYRKCPPSVAEYVGKKAEPVTRLRGRDECFRGHDLTVEGALRFINGDPARPVCRACDRLRVDAYLARKRAS